MAAAHKNRVGFEDTLNFTNSLCVAYTLCSAALRGWIRRDIYGIDDIAIAAATVLTLGLFAANYVALEYSAGKPWPYIEAVDHVAPFNQASIASVVTFNLSLYLSKSSVVAFLLRLTKDPRQILFHRICLACLAALALASTLLVTVAWPSEPTHYWANSAGPSACAIQSTRWKVWTAIDILTEILLLALPLRMTWNLQMPLKKKAAILGAFWLRLPIIALSAGRLVYTRRLCHSGIDLGLDSALVLIWLCVQATCALLASHFLALRALTLSFNSGFGFGFTLNAGTESYSMHQRSRAGVRSGRDGGVKSNGPAEKGVAETVGGGLVCKPSVWTDNGSGSEQGTLSIMRETEYSVQYQDVTDEAPILGKT